MRIYMYICMYVFIRSSTYHTTLSLTVADNNVRVPIVLDRPGLPYRTYLVVHWYIDKDPFNQSAINYLFFVASIARNNLKLCRTI